MRYDDSFNDFPADNGEDQNWCSALVYMVGALLMLLLGFIGNGVLK